MKTPNLKFALALSFCFLFLNVSGQSTNKTTATLSDTVSKATADTVPKNNKSNSSGQTNKKDTAGYGQIVGKTYIFNQNHKITECNSAGDKITNPTTPVAIRGTRFLITAVRGNNVVILINIWSLNKSTEKYSAIIKNMMGNNWKADITKLSISQKDTFEKNEKDIFFRTEAIGKRRTFNFKNYSDEQFAPNTTNLDSLNNNRYFFTLDIDSLKIYCSEFKKEKNWEINFGTLVTPFKLRFKRFEFSNNLSVGGAVYFQRKFDTDWSWGGVFALSLSSVTLDAASTNIPPDASGKSQSLTNSTSRPAFSPSIHGVITYKNINFTLGMGLDFISKPTDIASMTNPEAGWIYNGKPWIGIGLGFSLFSNGSSKSNTTPPLADQKDSTSQ